MAILHRDFFYKKSRLQQLKGFCNTYKLKTVTEAAKFMGLNPSTVTLQIQSLERDLNLKLFERKGRDLVPTKDADLFYKIIVPRLQAIDGVFEYFKDKKVKQKNKIIKIAGNHTVMNTLMIEYVQSFLKKYPKIKIELQILPKQEAFGRLIAEETDLAIYPVVKIPSSLKADNIFNLKPTLLMHRNNILANKEDEAISLKDLIKQRMIFSDKKQVIPYFVNLCKDFGIKSNIEFENGDWETVQNFVKFNMGICFFSDVYKYFPQFKDPNIVTKNISHLFPVIPVNLITKSGIIFNSLVKDFIQMVNQEYFLDK